MILLVGVGGGGSLAPAMHVWGQASNPSAQARVWKRATPPRRGEFACTWKISILSRCVCIFLFSSHKTNRVTN